MVSEVLAVMLELAQSGGRVSAALLYLKRGVTRRQRRVVVTNTAVSGICTSVSQAPEVGKASVARVLPTE